MKENLADAENRLKYIEQERHDLLHSQGTQKATAHGLEDQLKDVKEELKRAKEELTAQRSQYLQLR